MQPEQPEQQSPQPQPSVGQFPQTVEQPAQPAQNSQPAVPPAQPVNYESVPQQAAPVAESALETSQDEQVFTPQADATAYGLQPIQWQAPEYVQDPRSPRWFIGFWIVAIVLMAAAFFLLRSWSFALLVPAMAAALMIYSHRPPRTLSYVLSNKGIYINEKLHPMAEFKAFGITNDESVPSLVLIPVKRFRPALTTHFPAEIGEPLVDMLGRMIPMQEIKPDAFDKIIRKLHI